MTSPTRGTAVDFADVQGIVRFGHGKLTRACFYALRVREPRAARDWLRLAPVTTAETRTPPPETALHVALTARGMRALGVPDPILGAFSAEFVAGMAGDANRSRRLGDVGSSAPSRWRWGAGQSEPDLLVMLFATPDAWPSLEATTHADGWNRAFETLAVLHGDLDGREPFGFVDGLSQPEIDWAESRRTGHDEPEFTNLSALGEFVLGYRNEYGRFTERPLLDVDPGADLPTAVDSPRRLDLGRNGTYLVLRELHQDVRSFWHYLVAQAESPDDARRLAEAMVGRRIDGEPLVADEGNPIPGISRTQSGGRNHFAFAHDPNGVQCPRGAHIRRANPRNGDFAGRVGGPLSRLIHRLGFGACDFRDDRIASTRFHRVLRRGRRFGPALSPEAALQAAPAGDAARGIYFVCLNANISRQFEFIQNAWLMSASFDGLTGESDPLMGRRDRDARGEACNTFTIPKADGASRRLCGLPDFVTMRGGAYFFLPGIRALRYLSAFDR